MSMWSEITNRNALTCNSGTSPQTSRRYPRANELRLLFALFAFVVNMHHNPLGAQQPAPVAPSGTVKLNLRGETPIATLIEYVSQRLNIRFIYDESLAQTKIFLQAPDEIPVASMMDLLQSALRI
ncbi:MAG: hypothetical protein ABL921_35815, partial [Pirellula sp.]